MSWLRGYSAPSSKQTESEAREEKRKKLEAERLSRAQQRAARAKQLQVAIQSQKEADQALKDLLDIDPDIFAGTSSEEISEDEIALLLEESTDSNMAEAFDVENGTDGDKALDKLGTIKCPFDKNDVEFWFCELESQMEVIGVKSQWVKRIALQQFLPVEIRSEVKSLLMLSKPNAGTDIYKRIKTELLDLFGKKPEDAYIRAKNRVMTGKPSQLGKAILEDLCDKPAKLDGCCCKKVTWGMFREALPVVVRNHLAEMPFNKDTYKEVFTKADQVYDSNRPSSQQSVPQVAAAAPAVPSSEVAAVQRSGQSKPKNKGQNGQKNKNGQQNGQENKNGQKNQSPKPLLNDENLCRIHAKWKNDANFCAAPWGCKMKNVYKAPQ